MANIFNEDTRVKTPAILHLTRLGYTFIPRSKMINIHPDTNIFLNEFKKGISKINKKEYSTSEITAFVTEISNQLENNDLGRVFYKSLLGEFNCKLIDFENFENNIFNVVTELTYKKDEEEFRPDITVLINGMPLIFIEVKKPNNIEGILRERNRMNVRFKNKKFKKFMNITQLIIFSNNNEYDEESIIPIQGAFYATPGLEEAKFNCFREEYPDINKYVYPLDEPVEKEVLKDTNLVSILGTSEYKTNKDINTPTNRIITSLLCKDRLKIILKYGIAYVVPIGKLFGDIEKHIMRYPQLFATLAIEKTLERKIKKGIIWHTQGSGKTALAFFDVYYLRDYFQKKNIIAKFYFITDRLDLATQAKNEFESRGLKVEVVSSKEDFIKNIKTVGATATNTGEQTIVVVNIQKFSEDSISTVSDYNINVQRIYFLDEVQRSYNPKGSFLSNLITSDREAIVIGLTGTPLIFGDYKSTEIFGDYIHKYYYNKSIADGYTLKLIREEIKTEFKQEVSIIFKKIETQQGQLNERDLFAHPKFVEPLVNYITDDLKKSRILHNDPSIGGMVVCDSSKQARMIFEIIQKNKEMSAALILHDVDTKEIREGEQLEFKEGKIDLLVVYNMLLTGFDAKRLKKLYLARVVREHNLLQTLTRVNRPYHKFKYGFVVDFANIQKEFDRTNKEYFKELQVEVGDETENYSNLFKSPEEIDAEIDEIKEKLFLYDFSNLEEFQKVVSRINDKKEIIELKKCLENLKALYNIIKIMDYSQFLAKFSFDKINRLYSEVNNRLEIINLKEKLDNASNNTGLLNISLENMQFTFRKIREHELKIADQLLDELEKTRKEVVANIDMNDPMYKSLYKELEEVFKKKSFEELNSEEMNNTIKTLKNIFKRAYALNNKNLLIAAKYHNDTKFARIHKRIKEKNLSGLKNEMLLHEVLIGIKHKTDEKIVNNQALLKNEDFFSEATKRIILEILEEKGIRDLKIIMLINNNLVTEYLNEGKH
jgi:type I restriction enzyme, R subunit